MSGKGLYHDFSGPPRIQGFCIIFRDSTKDSVRTRQKDSVWIPSGFLHRFCRGSVGFARHSLGSRYGFSRLSEKFRDSAWFLCARCCLVLDKLYMILREGLLGSYWDSVRLFQDFVKILWDSAEFSQNLIQVFKNSARTA